MLNTAPGELLLAGRPGFTDRQGPLAFGPFLINADLSPRARASHWPSVVGAAGGRTLQRTRINIELTILAEKVEDYLHFLESVCLSASFQPFAPPRHVLVVSRRRRESQEISPRLRGGGHGGGRTSPSRRGQGRRTVIDISKRVRFVRDARWQVPTRGLHTGQELLGTGSQPRPVLASRRSKVLTIVKHASNDRKQNQSGDACDCDLRVKMC